jgi:hypothetical protein
MTDRISEILDIEPHDVTLEVEKTDVAVVTENVEDDDFVAARANYYEIIDQGRAAVNTAMMIAAETQNPRAIEVLSGLLKNMADINRQLINISKDRADVKTAKGTKSQQPLQQIGTLQQAVFVGNSAELAKLLTK